MSSVNLLFLILFFNVKFNMAMEESNSTSVLDELFKNKIGEYSNNIALWLEDFNNEHLGKSEFGRIINYADLKMQFGLGARSGRNMKKMGMALVPLIFHFGAASTWMMLTSIMAVKSVAIGLALLVFKIAVSSAKLAAFFTAWKGKHSHQEHGWTPHAEHHGYERSLTMKDTYYPADWSSHHEHDASEVSPPIYKSIPLYKNSVSPYEDADYQEDHKNQI